MESLIQSLFNTLSIAIFFGAMWHREIHHVFHVYHDDKWAKDREHATGLKISKSCTVFVRIWIYLASITFDLSVVSDVILARAEAGDTDPLSFGTALFMMLVPTVLMAVILALTMSGTARVIWSLNPLTRNPEELKPFVRVVWHDRKSDVRIHTVADCFKERERLSKLQDDEVVKIDEAVVALEQLEQHKNHELKDVFDAHRIAEVSDKYTTQLSEAKGKIDSLRRRFIERRGVIAALDSCIDEFYKEFGFEMHA